MSTKEKDNIGGVISTTQEVQESVVEKDKEIAELRAQIDALRAAKEAPTPTVTPTFNVISPSTDVSIVYMSDSLGVIEASNLWLNCTRFGETFTVTRYQFDEIVGKYRSWFEQGILAVSPKDIAIAAAKGVRTSDEYALTPELLAKMGKMTVSDLEKLWAANPLDSHRLSIVQYFKRKFMEGIDPAYQDRSKIDLLNRLTNGGLRREAKEISGFDLKIVPTDMSDF